MKVFAFILEYKSGKFQTEARWQHSSPFGHARASARRDRVWDFVSLQGLPEPLLET